ncbi:hypothetical protein [Streptomyces sp. SID9727]|uniref:hypothetical protein n=1 Tax=Streptomyces sp. SID9727 TaxID=2706114 RepID=UPI0013CA96B4|nr:hypothetical protein [Streptomyces sp. SID9727]NEC65799.1 hypothetical protein [Streptomyces sp. SID9727]
MAVFIGVVVGLGVISAACLVALRMRGGSGERGAHERGAAEQGQAQALAHRHVQNQNMGPYGG